MNTTQKPMSELSREKFQEMFGDLPHRLHNIEAMISDETWKEINKISNTAYEKLNANFKSKPYVLDESSENIAFEARAKIQKLIAKTEKEYEKVGLDW